MAKTKATSYYAKVVDKTTFVSEGQRLTIVLTQGKNGYNTHASVKGAKDERASTGGRATFTTQEDGEKAFRKLVAEAVKQGWEQHSGGSRNAFTEIPAPASKTNSKKK